MLANKQLREYMHTVFNLETQLRTVSLAINKNNSYAGSLGRPRVLVQPTKFSVMDAIRDSEVFASLWLIPVGVAGAALPLFLNGAVADDFLGRIFRGIFTVIGVLGAIMAAGILVAEIVSVFRYHKACIEGQIQYEKDCAADARRVEEERKKWMAVNEDTKILYDQRRKVKSALDQYYNLGIIYSKYWDILPVSMFVQYLDSGRATRLEGSDGCYNIFEYEVRQDIIIDKLDTVIEKLDDLSASVTNAQYELTNALNASNRQIQRLCSKTDDANRHLAAIEYQNQITANNTRVLAEYSIYRDLLR